MAQHSTIAMILITLIAKGCLLFLAFFMFTIFTIGKWMTNAMHANTLAMQQIH